MSLPQSTIKPSLFNQIAVLIFFRLLLNTARRFAYPFAPVLSRELQVSLGAITSMIATVQFTSLLGVFSGPVADRMGNRRLMRAGLAMLAVGMLICGLITSYWPVFLGLVLAALGKTVFDPAAQSFIGRHVPYARRGRVIGLVETSWAGATLIGVPLIALVIDNFGISSAFFVFALLSAISWLAAPRFFPADRPAAASTPGRQPIVKIFSELAKNRSAMGMLAFGFFVSLANDNLFVVYGVWFEHRFLVSIVTLGFSAVAIGLAELCGEALTALFVDRLGKKRAVIIGLIVTALSYLLLPIIAQSILVAMIGMFLIFLFFEFTIVSSFSLSTEIMPDSRATMMAGFYATAGIGRLIGVVAGGMLWQAGGITTICVVSAFFTLLALFSILFGLRGWRSDLAG
jgi:predicted MFS family arabinose efflux permease